MQKIGFTCGTFDLCHYGHIIMLAECKSQCDYLVVAVQEDPTVDRLYKNKNEFFIYLKSDCL